MRILHIVPSIDPQKGGRERHVLQLVRELTNLGHNVTIITSDQNFIPHDEAFELYTVSTKKIPQVPDIPSLRNLIRLMNQGFDLCHIHYHALFGEIAIIASRVRGFPVVVTVHAEIKRNFLKSIYDRALLLFTFRFSEKVICLSKSLREGLIRRGLNPKKMVVIPHFIDLGAVKANSREVGDPSYESDLLFVGRLERRKGVHELLQILSYLSKMGVRYNAYIVGEGPLKEQVESKISSYPLKKHVKYLGYVEESVLRKLYNKTKIVVVPSRYEGLPSVCLEAMSYGKVVLGFDIPGLRDILVDLDQSLVVNPFDIEEMAKKIIYFLNHLDHRLDIGKKAQEKVKKYDVHRTTEEICRLYNEVSIKANR